MLRVPTSRKRKRAEEKLNLVPIMDSIFIFIFFLLMSATFLRIYEIGSPVPIISDQEPPKPDKDPLALTLTVEDNRMVLSRGVPSRDFKSFARQQDGTFDLVDLHATLVDLKKKFVEEESLIFQPVGNIEYEEIVKILDTVRMLNKTDDAIFKTNKEGLDEKVKYLFDKIIFSNLMS